MSNELNKMQNSKQLQIIEKIRNKIEKNNSWFMIDGNLDMVFKKALDNLPALEKLTENNLKIQLEYYYQEEFNKIIKDKLLNDNNFVFMQLFLEHSIKKMNHHQESKKFLSSLLTVFANIDYSLTYADCLFIVKNGFVDNAMRNILLDENGNIKRDVISKNLNNNLFTLICPFCEIHSIDIETELEINLEKDGDSKETNISYVLTDHALGDYIKQIPNIKLAFFLNI